MAKREPSRPTGISPDDMERLLPPFSPKGEAGRWLFQLHRLGIRPGLDSIRQLLDRLGNPQDELPAVVVCGTNGKGSAAIILERLLASRGMKTALYSSPHLLDLRERIVVAGIPIERRVFDELVRRYAKEIEATGATFFEAVTALAMRHFVDEGVEVAVLEAGLGGRLDATNVARKIGVLLTSVGLDHTSLLGDTIEEIAREKLGLAEAGVPFYLQPLASDLREFVHAELVERRALAIELPAGKMRDCPVAGEVQRSQLTPLLAMAIDVARRQGWPEPDPAVLKRIRLPARYELYGVNPPLRVDPAHNAPALERVLSQWSTEGPRDRRGLVLGLMADKEVDEVLERVIESSSALFLCAPRWYRALPPAALAARLLPIAQRLGRACDIHICRDVRIALEQARAWAKSRDGKLLLCGSNFLLAEALDRLGVDDLLAPPRSDPWEGNAPLRKRGSEEGAMVSLGLDVGGTNCKLVLLDAEGVVLARQHVPTLASEGPRAFSRRVGEILPTFLERHPTPDCMGLAVAGLLGGDGTLVQAPNLPEFESANLAALLRESCGIEVRRSENDVNAALAGEWLGGCARGARNVVMFSLGTGVGGGLLLDGQLYHGSHGFGGELGHAVLDPDGPICGCGLRGHVESWLATEAITNEARRRLGEAKPGGALAQAVAKGEAPEPRVLAAAAEAGDPVARSVLDWCGHWLGLACANVANQLDPEVIVIGGGVSLAGDWLLQPAREEFERRSLRALRGRCELRAAALGQDGAAIGAALLSLQS